MVRNTILKLLYGAIFVIVFLTLIALVNTVLAQSPIIHSSIPMESPYKQFRGGIPASAISCEQDFILILKVEDGSPACVKPLTAMTLVERGWANQKMLNPKYLAISKIKDPFEITTLIINHPSAACQGFSCSDSNFYLKINSNFTVYLLGYHICNVDSCVDAKNISILLPINNIFKPNYLLIPLPVDLKWKYGDTVNIQLEVSSNADDKTTSLVDLGNSTIVS